VAGEPAGSDPAEAFFAGLPRSLEVYSRVRAVLGGLPGVTTRVTRSQVAFRRRRGFAWLWLPGRWLAKPGAEVVLSIGLDRRHPSSRFKEVVQPARNVWVHHLEVRSADEIDEEVAGWLREAYQRRG
jgi:hypothetical protein